METTRLDELPVHNNSTAASMGMGMGMGMGNNNNNVVIQQYDPNMIPGHGGNGNGTRIDHALAVAGVTRASTRQRGCADVGASIPRG